MGVDVDALVFCQKLLIIFFTDQTHLIAFFPQSQICIILTEKKSVLRATDNTKLSEIYSEINKMEKARTTIDSFPVYKELFMDFALVALICLLLEVVFNAFILKRLP